MLPTPHYFVITAAFVMGLAGVAFHRTHLLSALLSLEGVMVTLYLAISAWALQWETSQASSVPMLVLAFSACEAATGLALLVAIARTHGTGWTRNMNLLMC